MSYMRIYSGGEIKGVKLAGYRVIRGLVESVESRRPIKRVMKHLEC